VEVQWNNIKKCVFDTMSGFVVQVKRTARGHRLHRKRSVKQMNEGSERMSMKKEVSTVED
jgi:hypothetical protein